MIAESIENEIEAMDFDERVLTMQQGYNRRALQKSLEMIRKALQHLNGMKPEGPSGDVA